MKTCSTSLVCREKSQPLEEERERSLGIWDDWWRRKLLLPPWRWWWKLSVNGRRDWKHWVEAEAEAAAISISISEQQLLVWVRGLSLVNMRNLFQAVGSFMRLRSWPASKPLYPSYWEAEEWLALGSSNKVTTDSTASLFPPRFNFFFFEFSLKFEIYGVLMHACLLKSDTLKRVPVLKP